MPVPIRPPKTYPKQAWIDYAVQLEGEVARMDRELVEHQIDRRHLLDRLAVYELELRRGELQTGGTK